jgi:hypothetical protein
MVIYLTDLLKFMSEETVFLQTPQQLPEPNIAPKILGTYCHMEVGVPSVGTAFVVKTVSILSCSGFGE